MRTLLVIALVVAALPGFARADGRWEALVPEFGIGSVNCVDEENFVCAALMCEDGTLTLGILGTGHGGVERPVMATIDVDGVSEQRRVTSRIVAEEFLHIRTPIKASEPLVARMRSGRQIRITIFDPEYPFVYDLTGFPAEFERISGSCR